MAGRTKLPPFMSAAREFAEFQYLGAGVPGFLDKGVDEGFLSRRMQRAHCGALVEAVTEVDLLQPRG